MTIEEYIRSLNLADEVKAKAVENLKKMISDNYVEKTKFDEATTAKANLETQIKERDKQLETLKKQLEIKKNLKAQLNNCKKKTKLLKLNTNRI